MPDVAPASRPAKADAAGEGSTEADSDPLHRRVPV